MTPKEHLIQRLRTLCSNNGGPEAVAETARVSAENLKQILAGTKLPKTGHPRGVGPALQRKLDAAFPGWSGLSAAPPPAPGPTRFEEPRAPTDSEWAMISDIRAYPPEERQARMDQIRAEADKWRAFRDQVIAEMKGKP